MKKKLVLIMFLFIFFVVSLSVKGDTAICNVNSYYSNLDTHYSYNSGGTCTFVSTTMLLSYYDTYLNDDIIPEQYDVHSNNFDTSPGVYRETTTSSLQSIYIPELRSMKNYSLQGLLIDIAYNLGYNNGSITNANRIEVLKYYFSNYTNLRYDIDYSMSYITGTDQTSILNLLASEIALEKPVILNYDFKENPNDTERSGHSAIAYDYSNNSIICHLGANYEPNFTQYDIVQEYEETILTGIFIMNFNIPHKHSNNTAIDCNDYVHTIYCPCGYQNSELHNIITNASGIAICKSCKKVVSQQESFDIILDPSSNSLCGTEVSINGGILNCNTIVVGYTRIAYIQNSNITSRLEYNWFSSNTDVCEVTKYGTILAKNPGQAYIIASNKLEPYKYSIISINVNGDYSSVEKYISITTDCRTPSNLNGTEVTVNNGSPNEFTIHSGFSRALSFNINNVYPSIDNFYWYSDSSDIIIQPGGYIEAKDVAEEKLVTVNGFCIYNSNIRATIIFRIIP